MHLVSSFIRGGMREIFSTMLTMEITSVEDLPDEIEPPLRLSGVTGQVSLAGKFNGSVYLNFPEEFSKVCACNILGSTPQTIAADEVNDVIGELTNMVTGSLKSKMTDRGFNCQLSVPSVMRGADIEIDSNHINIKLYNEFHYQGKAENVIKVYVFARLEE